MRRIERHHPWPPTCQNQRICAFPRVPRRQFEPLAVDNVLVHVVLHIESLCRDASCFLFFEFVTLKVSLCVLSTTPESRRPIYV